jgi:crossover junction endodeoxyribonuclease RusA
MPTLSFTVFGQPTPQGSVRAFVRGGRAVVTSDNVKLRPWRDTVTWAARDALGGASERSTFPITGPVALDLSFHLHRPKSRPKTIDVYPLTPPDLDKLIRAIGDSLVNAGIIQDDALICDLFVSKRYAVGPDLTKIFNPNIHQSTPCVVVKVLS